MNWWRKVVNAGGTGGLNWHLHALTNRHRWMTSIAQLDHFLTGTRLPSYDHLLLIGCSAGWMMPPHWLQQFKRIDTFDIDPFARLLFGLRHGHALSRLGVAWQHHRMDALNHLNDLTLQHPHSVLWFDNLLGQLRYQNPRTEAVEQQLDLLKHQLQSHCWGSVHDWLSGPVDRSIRLSDVQAEKAMASTAHQPEFAQGLLQRLKAQGVWSDHLTSHVFPDNTTCLYLPWSFSQERWHWLQAGWVNL